MVKPLHRKLLKACFNNAVGDKIRTTLGIQPPFVNRPISSKAAISDIFPWRVDDLWETQFDILNIPALLEADRQADQQIQLVIFNQSGDEIERTAIEAPATKAHKINLRDYLKGATGSGTFSCFHTAQTNGLTQKYRSYIAERGYLSFRRKQDQLWSYVHGNQQAIAMNMKNNRLSFVGGSSKDEDIYRPQLTFEDCEKFEIVYANPTGKAQTISLRLFDRQGKTRAGGDTLIPPRGIHVFSINNHDADIISVQNSSRVKMWRPVIFKFYESHFNVLHA
jgi:hypothetical protein